MAETGALVSIQPYALTAAGVQSKRPVRGGASQWQPFAQAANHLLGRGAVLVPWTCTDNDLTVGATDTLRVRVFPRYAATHRVWNFCLVTTGTGGRAFGTFTDPSGGTLDYELAGAAIRTFTHVEAISSRTSAEIELAPTWSLDALSSKSARLLGWSCREVPRPELTLDANDYGVAERSVDPGAEILGGGSGLSVGSVAESAAAALSIAGRNGLFHWAVPTTAKRTTTSAGYARLFANADPLIQGRSLFVGDALRTVFVRVRASSGAGTTGNIRFTMSSGATLVLAVTSAMAVTWLSGTIAVDCDLFSDTRGRRRVPGDKCVIEWQRTGGANNMEIESISIIGG
jgi:hypothetical protein